MIIIYKIIFTGIFMILNEKDRSGPENPSKMEGPLSFGLGPADTLAGACLG